MYPQRVSLFVCLLSICHTMKKLGHYNSTLKKKTQTKLINHLFHCWINKVKLPRSNCQAALASAELHIGFNELTSQERRCSIHTAQKWLMHNWWVTQCGEFDVGYWWVSPVGVPMQMHSRHWREVGSHVDCRRNDAGIMGILAEFMKWHVWHWLCFLII